MEETYNTTGIVIKNEPWREFDSRVKIYTHDRGLLEMVARGTKKIKSKLAGHLEPATLVNLMVVPGRQWPYVGFATSENSYNDLKEDLAGLTIAGKIFKAVNGLIKAEESDVRVFHLLADTLAAVNEKKSSPKDFDLIYNIFIFKLLTLLGYGLELHDCVVCKSKILANNKSKIDICKGGLICPKCENKSSETILTISDNCLKIFRIIVKQNFKKSAAINVNKSLIKEIKNIIDHYQQVYQNL